MSSTPFTYLLCAALIAVIIGVAHAQNPCKVTVGNFVYDLTPLKRDTGNYYTAPVVVPPASIFFNICGYVSPVPRSNCLTSGPTQVYAQDSDECVPLASPSATSQVQVEHWQQGNPLALVLTIPKSPSAKGNYKTTIQINCSPLKEASPVGSIFSDPFGNIEEFRIIMGSKYACHTGCAAGWTGELCEEKVQKSKAALVIGLIIIIGIVVLAIVGGAVGYYFYQKNKKANQPFKQQYQMETEEEFQ